MNRIDWKSFREVLSFTVVQNLKSSGIKVTVILMSLIALFSMPVLYYFGGDGEGENKFPAKNVYIMDNSGFTSGDFSGMAAKDEKYKEVSFQAVKKEEKLDADSLQIDIMNEGGQIVFRYLVAEEAVISEEDMQEYSADFEDYYRKLGIEEGSFSKEQRQTLNTEIAYEVVSLSENGKAISDEDKSISMEQYFGALGIIIIMMLLISFSAETVSSSIVMEKSNKLVENLILCVKPSIMIAGKVVGALLVVMLQLACIAVAGVISAIMTKVIFDLDHFVVPEQIKNIAGGMEKLDAPVLLLVLLILLLGVVFYALLAGLFGAAISRIEEMAEGMKTYNFILIIGAYAGIGISMAQMSGADVESLIYILSFIPITAPFIVPMELFTGSIPLWAGGLAALLLLLFIVAAAVFVGKVYHSMLLYQGNTMKLKQILKIGRD